MRTREWSSAWTVRPVSQWQPMIEENVVSAAGADNEANERDLRYQIREAGFTPQQRDILYNYIYRDNIDEIDSSNSMPLKKLSVAFAD